MSGIVFKFANLRNIEKLKHEKEMLQLEHDEIKEKLEEDTKNGKTLPSHVHAKTTLNLRMLELKIAMVDNDISAIRYNSMGRIGDVSQHESAYCCANGVRR
jgi:hypothetical protein